MPSLSKKRKGSRGAKAPNYTDEDDDDGMMLEDESTRSGGGADEDEAADAEFSGEGDDGEEEVFIVEEILEHMVDKKTKQIKFRIKWEGWDDPNDLTWEPEENLADAPEILNEYIESIGGRERLQEDIDKVLNTKKRGRQSLSTISAAQKRQRHSHPADTTPPVSAVKASWKPPPGSWEEEIAQLDACEDEESGKLMVYLTWKNGQKTQHETAVIYKRCPQKMLRFYEQHVRIIKQPED